MHLATVRNEKCEGDEDVYSNLEEICVSSTSILSMSFQTTYCSIDILTGVYFCPQVEFIIKVIRKWAKENGIRSI
jgi:hypothetical protein